MSQARVREILRSGQTAIDLGANLGAYARAMCESVGPTGRVYACEPHSLTRQRGTAATPAAVWLPYAIGSAVGEAALVVGTHSAQCSLWPANVPDATVTTELVPLSTLDCLVADGILPAHIDFVKVDTQGSECAVLRGASALLARSRTTWLIECWPWGLRNAGESVDTLLRLLVEAGLVVSAADPPERGIESIRNEAVRMMAHESLDLVATPGAPV